MSGSIANWEKMRDFLTEKFGRIGSGIFWLALFSFLVAAAFLLIDLTQQMLGTTNSIADLISRIFAGVGAFLSLSVIILYFYLKRKQRALHTVHVVLPLSDLNRGDGLLQLAGFLAAWDEFPRLQFKFYDTQSDPSEASKLVQKILEDDEGKPIWIVVTMSATAALLNGVLESNILTPEQKERCTIVSTVSVAPASPHRPMKNFIRFSLDGSDEADAFWKYLKNDFDRDANGVLLLPLDSTYPRATCGELAAKIIDNKKLQCNVPMRIDGSEFGDYDLRKYVRDGFSFNRAVIIGYDLALFRAVEYIVEHGFQGKILLPTTMSVPDWQQYMRTSKAGLFKDNIEYFHLSIADTHGAKRFESALAKWNLAAIKSETSLANVERQIFTGSGCHPNEFAEQFVGDEALIYAEIQTNYVSAHCFEVSRLIDLCIGTRADRILPEDLEGLIRSYNKVPGALGPVECDERGIRPTATLSMEPLPKKAMQ